MLRMTALLLAALAIPAALTAEVAVTLRGSPESMLRQHRTAREADYVFHRTPGQIQQSVEAGTLVRLEGNADYQVLGGATAAARPEVKLFVERLAAEFRESCGYPMVVTSLIRATTRQPANAHPLSVHPAGMAVDLRVPPTASCRAWFDRTLLSMEAQGLIDATRENRPPHYHVAVFPRPYVEYLAAQVRLEVPAVASPVGSEAFTSPSAYPGVPAGGAATPLAPASLAPPGEARDRGWISRLVSRVVGIFRSA